MKKQREKKQKERKSKKRSSMDVEKKERSKKRKIIRIGCLLIILIVIGIYVGQTIILAIYSTLSRRGNPI